MSVRWQDGIDLKVYISRDGDFVSLGNRAEYPFVAGGSGIPAGWVMYNTAGTAASDVNFTTQDGRFSISNALAVSNGAKFYGAYRDFPVTVGHYYIFQLQARQMDGKTSTQRNIRYEWSNGSGTGSYAPAQTDWEQVSIPTGAVPAGVTYLRIIVQAVYYTPAGQQSEINWGAQFQNVSVIDQDPTYPEPEWDEITCEVQNLSLNYGRDKFVNRYDVGQMSLAVLNNDGTFTYDPTKTLRPGRFIKVEAAERAIPTTIHDQFYGIIDSLNDSFTLDGRATTVIQAVDISSLLSNMSVPTATWASSVYKSGSRFLKLLDAVAWHPTMRAAMTGIFNQQAILANGRTVRDELGLIADSEGGYFFADRSGKLVYNDRTWNTLYIRQVNAELMAQPVELITPMEPTVKFGFNGAIGNYLRVNYHTNFQPASGDMDIQVRVSMNNWGSSVYETFCARYEGGDLSWIFRKHNASGYLNLFLQGLGGSRISTAAPPVANGQRCWVRVTRTAVDGVVRFYWAPDTPSNTNPTVWTQLGADVTSTPGAPTVSNAGFMVGARSSGQDPLNGYIWVAYCRNGIMGGTTTTMVYVSTTSAKDKQGQTSFTISSPSTTCYVTQVDPFWVIQPDPTPGTPALPVVDDIPNVSGTNTPIICLRELQTTWSRDRVVNEVSLANQGGSSITTIDAPSQKKYGPKTFQRMDLLNTNDDISYLTTRTQDIMDGYTDAILRVNSVQFRPQPDNLVYWFSLRVFLNQLVRVRYTHPSGGWGFSVVSHVQGIQHTFTQTDWVMTLLLDNPEAFNYWNEATNAGWDVSVWDDSHALWDSGRADAVYWSSGQKWSEGHRWAN